MSVDFIEKLKTIRRYCNNHSIQCDFCKYKPFELSESVKLMLLKRSVLKVGFNTQGKAITRVVKMKFIEDFAEK
jgi:hypothetical protein